MKLFIKDFKFNLNLILFWWALILKLLKTMNYLSQNIFLAQKNKTINKLNRKICHFKLYILILNHLSHKLIKHQQKKYAIVRIQDD